MSRDTPQHREKLTDGRDDGTCSPSSRSRLFCSVRSPPEQRIQNNSKAPVTVSPRADAPNTNQIKGTIRTLLCSAKRHRYLHLPLSLSLSSSLCRDTGFLSGWWRRKPSIRRRIDSAAPSPTSRKLGGYKDPNRSASSLAVEIGGLSRSNPVPLGPFTNQLILMVDDAGRSIDAVGDLRR